MEMFNSIKSAAIHEIAFRRLRIKEKIVFTHIAEKITALNRALYLEE